MRSVRYRIPFVYDTVDESWGFKYLNDLVVTRSSNMVQNSHINCEITIEAPDETHAFLADQHDVEILDAAA